MRSSILFILTTCFTKAFGFPLNNPLKSVGIVRHGLSARGVSELIATKVDNVHEEKFNPGDDKWMPLPWTEFQTWALRDNVPKYVVSIPRKGGEKPELYVLWRRMSREVVEFNGYPPSMLQDKYRELLLDGKSEGLLKQGWDTPGILPAIDDYEFKSSGGLSGRVYGLPGVADGSNIETASVSEVQMTLPNGYIITKDGGFAYELGSPVSETLTQHYSLDGVARSVRAVTNTIDDFNPGITEGGRRTLPSDGDDAMLLNLAASTAILLAGSMAVNMLSHHLTVNLFWV